MITQERLQDFVTRMRVRALVVEGVDEEIRLAEYRQELKTDQEYYNTLASIDDNRHDTLDNIQYGRKKIILQEAKIEFINAAIDKLVESATKN